jgi:hypothetical protein
MLTRQSGDDNWIAKRNTVTISLLEFQTVVNALCEAIEVLGPERTSAHAQVAEEIRKALSALSAVIRRATNKP